MDSMEIATSTIDSLCTEFPSLRKFRANGFQVVPQMCSRNVVGLENNQQRIKFHLVRNQIVFTSSLGV